MHRHLIAQPVTVREINRHLSEFMSQSSARAVVLLDESGSVVARMGQMPGGDPAELSALLTCNFLVTHELARYLGDQDISVLFHEGEEKHFYMRRVGERGILAVCFEEATALGRIQMFTDKAAGALRPLLSGLEAETLSPGTLPPEFAEAADAVIRSVIRSANPTVIG
jgi:predicted regulator of Ras-like GTPase activity (Roadblock/LC7/MglB family)